MNHGNLIGYIIIGSSIASVVTCIVTLSKLNHKYQLPKIEKNYKKYYEHNDDIQSNIKNE